MAKIKKVEMKNGEQIKLIVQGTCIYPSLNKGQYWDNEKNKFITIDLNNCKTDNGQYYYKDNKISFGLSLLIDQKDEESIRALNRSIEYSIKIYNDNKNNKKKLNIKNISFPYWDGNEVETNKMYKNKIVLKCKSVYQPKVFSKSNKLDLENMNDKDYNGYICNVSMIIVPYQMGNNQGVTCRLNQIQFIEQDSNIQFNSNCDFELEEEELEMSDFENSKNSISTSTSTSNSTSNLTTEVEELPFI